ncbi:hypothetical protein SLH46_20780 [Draconibacterium sp. IB214405]|uniref:hypothetical protein n=1 Tax=Draconibacterium sp. IB214405 TaxID=3097352 RepID=UPI002A107C09|nr:hypothetical protein [Draconibacterium sp. IB214405]MDX8341646.1 hypothetical protein [Draconibacterium sp. IB214405]
MEGPITSNYKSKKKTFVPERYRYFYEDSERNVEAFIHEFEPNTLNVKGMTGCGATTMLLENYQPMILSCPTNELCDCKSNSDRHAGKVLWYKKGVTDEDILEYLEHIDVPKLIVVYDSTPYLIQALKRVEEEEVGQKYVLAIDEAHMMMTALSYRDKAIKNLTALLPEFENVQFITATPVPEEFSPEVFKNYNYVEYEWAGAIRLNVITSEQYNPIKAVVNCIESFRIDGKIMVQSENNEEIAAEELVIFLNSVKEIATIIKSAKLKPEECKVIVAEKYRNSSLLAEAFGIEPDEVEIAKASDVNKKYTFVTSKAFEGVDFYSESALSIVISVVRSKSTLLDMGVSLPQIAGRIRTPENQLKNTILFIYNTSSYGTSPKEQEENVILNIEEAERCIEIYDRCTDEAEKTVLRKRYSDDFNHGLLQSQETAEGIQVKLDHDAIKHKRYQNYITGTYCQEMKVHNALEQTAIAINQDFFFEEENVVLNYVRKPHVRELAKKYIAAKKLLESDPEKADQESIELKRELIKVLDKEMPILKKAYSKLGAEKMQTASNRSEKNLKAAIVEYDKLYSLRGCLNDKFEAGKFYFNTKIVELLAPEYYKLNIERPVKAIDIAYFFEVESKKKKDLTGIRKGGYLIKKPILKTRPTMLPQAIATIG